MLEPSGSIPLLIEISWCCRSLRSVLPPPSNPVFCKKWEKMKRTFSMQGVDPLSQISLSEDPLFLDFVLEREAQLVNATREDVNVFVELNMSLRAVNAIAQLKSHMITPVVNSCLVLLFSRQFEIPKKRIKIAAVKDAVLHSFSLVSPRSFDLSLFRFPILIAVLDLVDEMPRALAALGLEFRTMKWDFASLYDRLPEYDGAIDAIREELALIREMLAGIVDLPCGRQLAQILQVWEAIESMYIVLKESGLEMGKQAILAAALPESKVDELVVGIVRIAVIHLRFTAARVQVCSDQFEKFEKFLVVVAQLLALNKGFWDHVMRVFSAVQK
jgi:hypothetical protein